MENAEPLLSICIPTYNRAEYLDKSIASIVRQKDFVTGEVELVISDNASEDNTKEVVEKYQKEYKNIFYSRNDKNIYDRNFPTVIGKAHGIFRKLCNDTIIFRQSTILHLLDIVKNNLSEKPVLFFLNKIYKKRRKKMYRAKNLEEFVKIPWFWTSWIGAFGIWEDDFNDINDKIEGCELHLWQTKILLEMVIRKRRAIVNNEYLFFVQVTQKKDVSYGMYKVFYDNFLGLYQRYLKENILSEKTMNKLKRKVLGGFFFPNLIIIGNETKKYQVSGDDKDIRKVVIDTCGKENYLLAFYFNCYYLQVVYKLKKTLKSIIAKNPVLTRINEWRLERKQ